MTRHRRPAGPPAPDDALRDVESRYMTRDPRPEDVPSQDGLLGPDPSEQSTAEIDARLEARLARRNAS